MVIVRIKGNSSTAWLSSLLSQALKNGRFLVLSKCLSIIYTFVEIITLTKPHTLEMKIYFMLLLDLKNKRKAAYQLSGLHTVGLILRCAGGWIQVREDVQKDKGGNGFFSTQQAAYKSPSGQETHWSQYCLTPRDMVTSVYYPSHIK